MDRYGVSQWTYHFNGNASIPYDAGTSIIGDKFGNIYVGGVSSGNTSGLDFITLSLTSSTGSLNWLNRYDGHLLDDFVHQMIFTGANNLAVIGGSQKSSTPLKWEAASIIYHPNTGAAMDTIISSGSAEEGVNEFSEMVLDQNGNIIMIGSQANQGTGNDIHIVKLDDQLNTIWQQVIDLDSSEDKGISCDVDDIGNVYIAGFGTSNSGDKDYFIAKLDSMGQSIWNKTLDPSNNYDDQIFKVSLIDTLGILVYGVTKEGQKSQTRLDLVSPDGLILTQTTKQYGLGTHMTPLGLQVDSDGTAYLLESTKDNLDEFDIALYQFNLFQKPRDYVYFDSSAHYVDRQLLVRFNPNIIQTESIDNRNKVAGFLPDFIAQNIVDSISQKLNLTADRLETYKVIRNMTTADSVSITRLNDTVAIPEYWSILSIFLPEGSDMDASQDSLMSMFPVIFDVEKNYCFRYGGIPNDDLYLGSQGGLSNNLTYGTNVQGAWDIQVGQSHTKVGVFDSGINWEHEDFGDGTFDGSVIEGGWDWVQNVHPSELDEPDSDGHGTAVSGIIGAIKNNDQGIAGIAGLDDDNGGTGCQLFSFDIGTYLPWQQPQVQNLAEDIVESVIESSAYNPNTGFGYGLHIQNYSWGYPIPGGNINGTYVNGAIIEEAFEFAFRQGVIQVAISGNIGDSYCDDGDCLMFPGGFDDRWILKIGASDGDGERASFSAWGENLDILAPGVAELYATLDHDDNSGYEFDDPGTSFSTPIVAGVAALMHSEHHINNGYPNNLAPADIEYFLETFSSDLDDPGYDIETGFGRLDAYESLFRMSLPKYHVHHAGGKGDDITKIEENATIIVAEGTTNISTGTYFGDKYEVKGDFETVLEVTESAIDIWPRYSSSQGFGANNPVIDQRNFIWTESINGNIVDVETKTYCWHLKSNINGQTLDIWYPARPEDLVTDYSIYVCDNSITSSLDLVNSKEIVVYPNPSDDYAKLGIAGLDDIRALRVYTAQGFEVLKMDISNDPSFIAEPVININNLTSGAYLIVLDYKDGTAHAKLIKQ